MTNRRWLLWVLGLAAALLAVGCARPSEPAIDRETAQEIAWHALAPNTSSGDRANWQLIAIKQVQGREVTDEFEGEPSPGCWQGPTPMPNGEIDAGAGYWYVEMRPEPATPLPTVTLSPTAPPLIPEPFVRQALFLIDSEGNIVARKLFCVIY